MKITKPFNNVSSAALRLILPSIKSLSQVTFKRLSKRAGSKENAAVNAAESLDLFTDGKITQCKCSTTCLEAVLAWNRPSHVTTVKRNYQKYQQHRRSLNRNEENSERKISKYCQSSPIFKPQWKKIGKVLWNGNLQKFFQSNCPYGLTTSSVCSNMKTITTPNRPCPRLTFCQQFINTTAQDPQFLSNLVTSDEAVFTMNSEVNTRNVICYSQYGQGHPQDYYVGHKQGAESSSWSELD